MLYTKVPAGVLRRSSEYNLDIISEMSGNCFALNLPRECGWFFVPAPKIVVRNDQRITMFWPADSRRFNGRLPFRKNYFTMTARPGKIRLLRLRVNQLQLGTTPLPVLDLPEHYARRATHGPHQPNADADPLAAQLHTVTLDGPAGAGVNEAVGVDGADPVAEPMDV